MTFLFLITSIANYDQHSLTQVGIIIEKRRKYHE
jgi:hypothetical protein